MFARQLNRTSPLLISILAFGASATFAASSSEGCIEDWSVASRIVTKEGLAPVERLSAAAGTRLDGTIVRTTLCRENGKYVYRVLVRSKRGEISKHSLDAQRPFEK